jgi:hypothetical protein
MEITDRNDTVIASNSRLNGSSFVGVMLSGVSITGCKLSGLRINFYLVSDLIAAYRKNV